MPQKDTAHDLSLLVRSRYGLIHLDTDEEERVLRLLREVSDRLALPLFIWTPVKGIYRVKLLSRRFEGGIFDTKDAKKACKHIIAASFPGLYFFPAIQAYMERDPVLVAHLKEAAVALEEAVGCVVIAGSKLHLPAQLEQMAASMVLPAPSEKEYRMVLAQLIKDLSGRRYLEVSLSKEETTTLVKHLSGLSLQDAEKILTKAIIEDGRLEADDIRHVIKAKKAVIEKEGLLEYYPADETMKEIADLVTLKAWLAKRKEVVTHPDRASDFGLTFPRGVLLLGVPGCGKSLSAKAVASEWQLPLLKLDPSNLYEKYIGESEENFKKAMKAAERMAPVVLWIDELEKAFAAGGSEDGGVSQRILGSFLSWMQDRRGDVFIVATANDIHRLPPEFLRKGRFDEIFFVDLPDPDTRREIFRIHLARREQDPGSFDVELLANQTDGFSGSEIEGVVVSGLYTAFSDRCELDTGMLTREIRQTRPLSVTMAEKISELRDWATGRTVLAN